MIPINILAEWEEHAPWAHQSQIEQDLVLSRALVSLFQNPVIHSSLAFRGGTALNKLYCNETARYSEDIDLVHIKRAPIGDVMSVIRETIDPWLGKPKWKQTLRSVKFLYRFQSEDKPSAPLKLKIEINIVESICFFGFQEKPYAVDNQWFSGEANIRTYQLEELMATKFRALYQRAKGRDLYDLWMAIEQLGVNCGDLLEAFKFYSEEHSMKVSRAEYEKSLIQKMTLKDFLDDAKRVLPGGVPWNPEHAFNIVSDRLVRHLPGEPFE
jgi:predicted nucleotidyltransferase component of viral defense system